MATYDDHHQASGYDVEHCGWSIFLKMISSSMRTFLLHRRVRMDRI